MSPNMDSVTLQKAASYVKTLIKNVKCIACSNIIREPVIGECGHVACSTCWSSSRACRSCGLTSSNRLRPDTALSARTRAVLHFVGNFHQFSGLNVLERSSSDESLKAVVDNQKESSEELFKDNSKRFSKKYERRKALDSQPSPLRGLLSVSQQPDALIFPGEEVGESFRRLSNRKNNSDCSFNEKVVDWLKAEENDFLEDDFPSVSQVNRDPKFYSGPVRFDFTKKPNPDFFKTKKVSKDTEMSAGLIDFDEIQVLSSEYIDEVDDGKPKEDSKDTLSGCSRRSNKRTTRRNRAVSDDSVDEITQVNTSLKMSTSAIIDIIGIPQEKSLNSSDEVKNKNPWKTVKQLKKILKKKTTVKKLDISIEKHAPVMINGHKNKDSDKFGAETQIVIEECITPHSKRRKFADEITMPSPDVEAVRNCRVDSMPSVISLDTELLSDKTFVDKDCLALQKVLEVSKHIDTILNSSESSSIPPPQAPCTIDLTRVDEPEKICDKDDRETTSDKLNTSRVVKEILSDFNVDDNVKMQVGYSRIKSLSIPRQLDKIERNAFSLTDPKIHSESLKTISATVERAKTSSVSLESNEICNPASKQMVRFVYGSKLTDKNSVKQIKKIPFFYKSNCVSKNWRKAPQDGVNIEICRDNVITSIVVRNQPLVDNLPDDSCSEMKIVTTRDAQTSPIAVRKTSSAAENTTIYTAEKDSIDATGNKSSQSILVGTVSNNPEYYDGMFEKESEVISSFQGVGLSKQNVFEVNVGTESKKNVNTIPLAMLSTSDNEVKNMAFGLDKNDLCQPENTDGFHEPTIAAAPLHKQMSEIIIPSLKRNTDNDNVNKTVNSKLFDKDMSLLVIENSDDHSQISDSTLHTKSRKRSRITPNCSDMSLTKKFKLNSAYDGKMPVNNDIEIRFKSQADETDSADKTINADCNSEPMNYEEIIGTVFADIDNRSKKKNSYTPVDKTVPLSKVTPVRKVEESVNVETSKDKITDSTDLRNVSMEIDHSIRCSDVIFDTERFTQHNVCLKTKPPVNIVNKHVETSVENNIIGAASDNGDGPMVCEGRLNTATPNMDKMDSDNSVVEDTPQKPRKTTFARKLSQRSNSTASESVSAQKRNTSNNVCGKVLSPVEECSHLFSEKTNEVSQTIDDEPPNLIDICSERQDELISNKQNSRSDTPLSITRFNNDVKYRSTPVTRQARRSLTYNPMPNVTEEKSLLEDSETPGVSDKDNVNSYQSPAHMKSRIENEFLDQAFDSSTNNTPKLPTDSSDGRRSSILFPPQTNANRIVCRSNLGPSASRAYPKTLARAVECNDIIIACSRVRNQVMASIKLLVTQRQWRYSDAYKCELTHLIVDVDDSNRSQRSVKYMRALAAGIWILNGDWILECLKTKCHVNEEPYEVLDSTGLAGPMISRTRTEKIFTGITFFCFPPFALLDVDILTEIITNGGGKVVEKFNEIKIKDPNKICIILGELDNTQEDRFINMCVKDRVVPVNIEWALDSLGTGSIISINNWLLGPRALLPEVNWPEQLFPDDDDEVSVELE